jgi:hypothetical protein
MPRGEVFSEKGAFWFEGHFFQDDEIVDFSFAEHTKDRRLDVYDTLTDRYFSPSRPSDVERAIQAHMARVAREEPEAEEVVDFPPIYNENGKRVK